MQVWHLSMELVRLVGGITVRDIDNRNQAREAASSCARNIAEGAARSGARDKARV